MTITKQDLREEFQFMQDHYSDPADRERQVIYIAAEALLDELEAAAYRIVALQQKSEIDPRTHQIIDLQERIAELEAREVKIPELKMLKDYLSEVTHREREDILLGVKLELHRELQSAGIITKVGE